MRTLIIVTRKIQSFTHGKGSFQMVWVVSGFITILPILYRSSAKSTTAISSEDCGLSPVPQTVSERLYKKKPEPM